MASNAVKIAKALNVTVEYLVEGQNSAKEIVDNNIRQIVEHLSKLSKNELNIVSGLIKLIEENK